MKTNPASEPPRIFTPEYYARMRELEHLSWWNAGMRDIAGMLLRRVRLAPAGTLLDAGCGSGQTMKWFLGEHEGWQATGIDVAAEGIKAARLAGLSVQQASVLALPFGDNSIDLVITLDVLQHLPLDGGDGIALGEFSRVLKPGGILLVRTNAQSFPPAADDHQYSFRKYEPEALRRAIVSAGFDIELLGRTNAMLGLAEIPRELRAGRAQKSEYHGILAEPRHERSLPRALKRAWLGMEGRALAAGWKLPFGRTMFALCRAT